MTPKIEEVVSYMRKIQSRYPGVEVFFENRQAVDERTTFTELSTGYVTTLDLDDNLDPAAVNVPVE